jgi:hypothetical protein
MTLTPRLVQPLGEWPPLERRPDANAWRKNKAATDPEYKARLLADKKRYRLSLKEDPVKYAKYLEQKRESYHRRKKVMEE